MGGSQAELVRTVLYDNRISGWRGEVECKNCHRRMECGNGRWVRGATFPACCRELLDLYVMLGERRSIRVYPGCVCVRMYGDWTELVDLHSINEHIRDRRELLKQQHPHLLYCSMECYLTYLFNLHDTMKAMQVITTELEEP